MQSEVKRSEPPPSIMHSIDNLEASCQALLENINNLDEATSTIQVVEATDKKTSDPNNPEGSDGSIVSLRIQGVTASVYNMQRVVKGIRRRLDISTDGDDRTSPEASPTTNVRPHGPGFCGSDCR